MLSAFLAFTGCDYTVSFKRKEKVTRFKLLEKNTEAREVFTEMSTESVLDHFVKLALKGLSSSIPKSVEST